MNVREFLTKWGFEIEDKKLDKVERQLEGIKNRLTFLGGVEVAKKLFELAENFAKFGEELHLAATSAGLTAESFQKLAYSAKMAGVEQGEMESSMKILSRRLYEARLGSVESQKAFALLGFTGGQVAGFKTSKDALFAVADRFQKIKDPIEKAALAQQLMGRGSLHMVGFLSQGSRALKEQGDEAERLGLILSGEQLEAIVEMEHSLQKLWALFKAIGAVVAAEIAPSMKSFIADFIKFFSVNRDLIQLNIKNWLQEFLYSLGYLWGAIEIVIGFLIKLAKAFHLEGQILPIIMTIFSLVLALFAVVRAGKMVATTLSNIGTIIKLVRAVMFSAFGPWIVLAAAVAFALHEIWNAFHGEKTWTQEFLEWIGIWDELSDGIQAVFEWVSQLWDKISRVGSVVSGILKGGSFMDKVSLFTNPVNTIVDGLDKGGGGNNSVNAPITINVPPGTDPKDVGKHVQNGVREHLDRTMRETQRSSTSAVAY